MDVLRTVFRRYLGLLLVINAALLAVPLVAIAEQASSHVQASGFMLTTDQAPLLLKATKAPLKVTLNQVGEELNIQLDAQVADDFPDFHIDEALRLLTPNYAIFTGQDDEKITTMVVMPEGEASDTTAKDNTSLSVIAKHEQNQRRSKLSLVDQL